MINYDKDDIRFAFIIGIVIGFVFCFAITTMVLLPQEIDKMPASEKVIFCQQKGYDGATWDTISNDFSFDCAKIIKKKFSIIQE